MPPLRPAFDEVLASSKAILLRFTSTQNAGLHRLSTLATRSQKIVAGLLMDTEAILSRAF